MRAADRSTAPIAVRLAANIANTRPKAPPMSSEAAASLDDAETDGDRAPGMALAKT